MSWIIFQSSDRNKQIPFHQNSKVSPGCKIKLFLASLCGAAMQFILRGNLCLTFLVFPELFFAELFVPYISVLLWHHKHILHKWWFSCNVADINLFQRWGIYSQCLFKYHLCCILLHICSTSVEVIKISFPRNSAYHLYLESFCV